MDASVSGDPLGTRSRGSPWRHAAVAASRCAAAIGRISRRPMRHVSRKAELPSRSSPGTPGRKPPPAPIQRLRRLAKVGLAGIALSLIAGCGDRLPTYRYRLTVEVETPEGLRIGSSVIEVRTHKGAAFPGPEAATAQVQVRGEAVAVDLGYRGVVFALLTGPDRE